MNLPPEIATLILVQCDIKTMRQVCRAFRELLPTRVHRYKGSSADHYAFLTTCAGIPIEHREIRPNLTLIHVFSSGAPVRVALFHKKRKFICDIMSGPPRFDQCVLTGNLEYRQISDGTSLVLKCSDHVKLIHNDLITFYL